MIVLGRVTSIVSVSSGYSLLIGLKEFPNVSPAVSDSKRCLVLYSGEEGEDGGGGG